MKKHTSTYYYFLYFSILFISIADFHINHEVFMPALYGFISFLGLVSLMYDLFKNRFKNL
jgi:hypothetical protein